MELFLMEHKKLWQRRTTKVCICLCFVYIIVIGDILSYQWFTFGSSNGYTSFSNNFDGYDTIRKSQQYAHSFGGELTDESLQQMVRDYQNKRAAGMEKELELTDQYKISGWLGTLWPELVDSSSIQQMISYVDPEKLTGFYERRQQAIEKFMEISDQTGKEKEYLDKMGYKVQTPFRYEWTEGWSVLLGSILSDLGMIMALFLSIVLSPLFAGEWHDNTSVLMLTTKNGWRETALAKILAGLCFTLELFGMIAVGNIASQLFFLGTSGWDMPIQNIKLIAIAPLNMLQAEIYEYVFTLLGAVGFAGIAMLLSAVVKSSVLALLSSLAVIYVPMLMENYLPFWLQKAKDLIPLVGSAADIFRTNTFCVFGRYIWSPYLLITVPVLIGLLCTPFAVKRWSRRMRV